MSSRLSKTPKEKEAKLAVSRQKFFEESKFDPYKEKYGLFSYTGSLAIGDDSYDKRKIPERNPDGSVKTAPKNFLTKPVKSGKTTDVYFSAPQFHTIGDKYKDPDRVHSIERERASKMYQQMEAPFKPCGSAHEKVTLFDHMPERVEKTIKRKLPDGSVELGPRNFLTKPPKKGHANSTPGVTLGEYPEYKSDPYERKRELLREEKKRQRAKMQEAAFKTVSHGNRPFSSDADTFGGDLDIKPRIRPHSTVGGVKHDRPFIPSNPPKSGIYDKTLSKFPEYIPDPMPVTGKPEKKEEAPWR